MGLRFEVIDFFRKTLKNPMVKKRVMPSLTGTYSETFSSVLSYFIQVIFEVTYVGLVHYGFVTLHRNHSHLVL